MKLAIVTGRVIPSCVYKGLEGVPFLVVQPVNPDGSPRGKTVVAADSTRMAGPGELVFIEGGREAALALDPWFVPVDHTIIGIVDGVELKNISERA